MDLQALKAELAALKSDYIRLQQDHEKVIFVGGRESSTEKELDRLEKEIAKINRLIDQKKGEQKSSSE